MEATAIKERPILFRAAMVRAILDGRKRQTRRLVKPQPIESPCNPPVAGEKGAFYVCPDWFPTAEQQGSVLVHCEEVGTYHCMGKKQFIDNHCPYGQPGDRLWVREAFYYDDYRYLTGSLRNKPSDFDADMLYFRAAGECCQQIPECECASVGKPRWRNARFMPRWASRITLEVTEVRVERLQEITEEDAKAEGTGCAAGGSGSCEMDATRYIRTFQGSWNSHNAAPFDWASNPWVWAVSFRRVEQGVRA